MSSQEQTGVDEQMDNLERVMQAEFDWTNVAPSTAVIEVTAEAANLDSTDLEPLYESVDPDALDRLFRDDRGGTTDRMLSTSFWFSGFRVSIRSSGVVELYQDA